MAPTRKNNTSRYTRQLGRGVGGRNIQRRTAQPFLSCNNIKEHIKNCKKCKACKKKAKKTNKPRGNRHFPLFFSHVCKRFRSQKKRCSGKIIMILAAQCWKVLSPGQKQHFIKCNSGNNTGASSKTSGNSGNNTGASFAMSGNSVLGNPLPLPQITSDIQQQPKQQQGLNSGEPLTAKHSSVSSSGSEYTGSNSSSNNTSNRVSYARTGLSFP